MIPQWLQAPLRLKEDKTEFLGQSIHPLCCARFLNSPSQEVWLSNEGISEVPKVSIFFPR